MLVLERPAPAQAGIHHIQVQHQTSSAQFGPFGKPSEFNGKIHAIVIRTGRSRIAFSSRARIFCFAPTGLTGYQVLGHGMGKNHHQRPWPQDNVEGLRTVPELAGNYRFVHLAFVECLHPPGKVENAAGPFPEPIPENTVIVIQRRPRNYRKCGEHQACAAQAPHDGNPCRARHLVLVARLMETTSMSARDSADGKSSSCNVPTGPPEPRVHAFGEQRRSIREQGGKRPQHHRAFRTLHRGGRLFQMLEDGFAKPWVSKHTVHCSANRSAGRYCRVRSRSVQNPQEIGAQDQIVRFGAHQHILRCRMDWAIRERMETAWSEDVCVSFKSFHPTDRGRSTSFTVWGHGARSSSRTTMPAS